MGLGELRRRGFRRPKVATISPRRMTERGSVAAMISRSLWVMRMTVLALAFKGFQQLEQGIGFRWGQHGGRLVEDQDIGAAIEAFRISTRCCRPNRKVADAASTSTSSPYRRSSSA
jgi:hypothetical protein